MWTIFFLYILLSEGAVGNQPVATAFTLATTLIMDALMILILYDKHIYDDSLSV